MIMQRIFTAFILVTSIFLSGCEKPEPQKDPVFEPASFEELTGWDKDEHDKALLAFRKSCERILKQPDANYFGAKEWSGTYADWKSACHAGMSVVPLQKEEAKAFFERYFTPVKVSAGEDYDQGLFTGYYEASITGTRTKKYDNQVPIHARPDDLIMVNLGLFREEFNGERIAGYVRDGNLMPYQTRDNLIKREDLPIIAWANDPVDAFFMHIQGSGRIYLEDMDQDIRVGYAGQNGQPYLAIGRVLVHKGYMQREDVTLKSIKDWLNQNPDMADEIMNQNGSYVFFKEQDQEGPIGGENVMLTAERSLAIDSTIYPYGMPIWVDVEHPDRAALSNIRQLMVGQDTGGAIRGIVRGDFFWGYGDRAEDMAGKMKSKGGYWFLLPKDVATRL